MTASRRRIGAELLAMTVLILSYVWLWQGAFPGDFNVCLLLYFGLGFAIHWQRGETPREIGFRLDNLPRALLHALLVVGPLVAVPVVVGAWFDTLHYPELSLWPAGLAERLAWGTAQQYGLLAVYYRRFDELTGHGWRALVAASGVFALFHLPNPFLTAVTLLAGAIACWLYARVPNLWALGLAHAALSFSIDRSISPEVTAGMRVGAGYWHF